MSLRIIESACREIAKRLEQLTLAKRPPVILVSPEIRPALRQMTLSHLPGLAVLSYNEITPDTKIEVVAMANLGK